MKPTLFRPRAFAYAKILVAGVLFCLFTIQIAFAQTATKPSKATTTKNTATTKSAAPTKAASKTKTASNSKTQSMPQSSTQIPSTVSVKLDTATINLVANADDKINSTQSNFKNIAFILDGNPPKADINVTLVLNDLTDKAKPLFKSSIQTTSNTLSVPIPKSKFLGIGKIDTFSISIPFQFIKTANELGRATVKIAGQQEQFKLKFPPVPAPKVNHKVELANNSIGFQLDTLKPSVDTSYALKLSFNLPKAIGADVYVKPFLQLVDTANRNKITMDLAVDSIKIASNDWNSEKDTLVSKTIYLFIKQNTTISGDIGIDLYLQGGKNRHRITLIASKLKTKTLQTASSGHLAILPSKVGITRSSGTTNAIYPINIKVLVSGEWDVNHNQLVFNFLDTNAAKHFKIMENPLSINKLEWDRSFPAYLQYKNPQFTQAQLSTAIGSIKSPKANTDTGLLNIPLHVKITDLNDSIASASHVELVLGGQHQISSGSQKIKLSTRDNTFWAEVGVNFDVLDKIKTNNFYAGVFAFDKDVGKLFSTSGQNNLSFIGGVYEAQSVTNSSTSSAGIVYHSYNPTTAADGIYRTVGPVTASTSVKSVGLLISPHVKLTNGATDANGLHLFASFYAEMLWQTITTNFSYPKSDSTLIATPTTTPYPATLTKPYSYYPYKENSIIYDFRSQYFCLGLPFYIKEKGFNLYINVVNGVTNQNFYIYNSRNNSSTNPGDFNYINNLTFLQPAGRWNGFFLFQYRLNEIAYGITFSGEIRGLLIRDAKPVVTLGLSKKFDLSALLKPLVTPF